MTVILLSNSLTLLKISSLNKEEELGRTLTVILLVRKSWVNPDSYLVTNTLSLFKISRLNKEEELCRTLTVNLLVRKSWVNPDSYLDINFFKLA